MSSNLTSLRVQLHALGYNILPNIGKVPAIKGWNTPEYLTRELLSDAAADKIPRWPLRWPGAESTGARLDDLVVIDIDVDNAMADQVMDAIADIAPNIHAAAPCRFGASRYKRALFCRLADGEEPFRRLASHKYEEAGHAVEVFGGGRLKGDKCSRQFGIYGPHSYNDDGTIAAEYRWDEVVPALHEIAHDQLPRITRAQCAAIADAFDVLAAEAGWQRQAGVVEPGAAGQRIYDIDEDTRFDVLGQDEPLAYDELEEGMRCSSSFFDGIAHETKTKCHVGYSPLHDCLVVNDYETDASHYPKAFAPVDPSEMAAQLKAVLPQPTEPPEPGQDSDLHTKAEWLTQTRAYFEAEDVVVQLYSTSLDCRTTPTAFGRRYKSWHQDSGKTYRGGPVLAYATTLWELTPQRRNVAGVRMRPDQPFPLYEERGRTFKNTYRRLVHATSNVSTVAPFDTFMERFIPEAAERDWFLDWMAHKQARPDIPGTAVFLVADTDNDTREGKFGTGRGLFFKILHRLYGEDYTSAQDFNILDGTSSQSTYTDWMHGAVLITVDEAKTSSTSYRRGERKTAYEVLKDIVDPAPKRRAFKGKNRQAFDGYTYASYVVATNHANAAAIPENDRRFTVLRNGDVMTREEALEIVAWMDDPANIGALSQALAMRDLTGFDMMAPLATAGKTEMAELARSEVEEVLRGLIEDINETPPLRGMVFTKPHIELIVEHNFNGRGAQWRGELEGAWHDYCVGPRTKAGGYRTVRMHGTKKKLFCFRVHKREVDGMPEARVRREVDKWGSVTHDAGAISIVGANKESEGDQQVEE